MARSIFRPASWSTSSFNNSVCLLLTPQEACFLGCFAFVHGGDHIAIINLQKVLDGALAGGTTYDPEAATPKDIAYFAIP